jgi:uncharacterized phiE125 gp8 family phage protein
VIARQVTGPTAWPVTVAEARRQVRVLLTAEDQEIFGFIKAATTYAEQTTGRAFATQVYKLTLDAFPTNDGSILLTPGPVVSVPEVAYRDVDDLPAVMLPADYWLDGSGADGVLWPSISWPETHTRSAAVSVSFVTGGPCPEDVRHAILLLMGHFYENRTGEQPPAGVETLLGLHRRIYV